MLLYILGVCCYNIVWHNQDVSGDFSWLPAFLMTLIVVLLSISRSGTMQHLVSPPPAEWQTVWNHSQAGEHGLAACFYFLFVCKMASGSRVDTELCKSTCLPCGLSRSMCRLGEFFEELRTLPVQIAEADVAQPLQASFSHVAVLGVCSLQL